MLICITRQSTIIGKLSSHHFASRTKKVLWEMNALLLSHYLLDYIDNTTLRQAVQGALNCGEAYHQLRRHIAIANGRQFRDSTEMEVSVWNECARLLTNAIIYYNAMLLEKLIQYCEKNGKVHLVEQIKRLSPVAWQHINCYGRYEFMVQGEIINIDAILRGLSLNDLSF